MIKDSFPLRVIFRPAETFSEIASGRTGWAWPLGLYVFSSLSSAALLAAAPAEFLAKTAGGLPPPAGGFTGYLFTGLPGGLAFAFFSCALVSGFAAILRSGRLMWRVPLPAAATAVYAFFFIARHNARASGPSGWAAAAAALGLASRAALRDSRAYLQLVKAFLSLSVFAAAADLSGATAALAGSCAAYMAAEYFFSFISLIWFVKAVTRICGLPAARASAAVVPALLGAAAFAFSLLALGLLGPEVFQLLLLM